MNDTFVKILKLPLNLIYRYPSFPSPTGSLFKGDYTKIDNQKF